MKPEKRDADQVAAALRDMADAVESGDSFNGTIAYNIDYETEGLLFDVVASYRIGNRQGQGGVRTIGKFEDPGDAG